MSLWVCNCGWNGDDPDTQWTYEILGCEPEEVAEDEVCCVEVCPECYELVRQENW